MTYQRILCAHDGCEHSDPALAHAAELALEHGAELHVLQVDPSLTATMLGAEYIGHSSAERHAWAQRRIARLERSERLVIRSHFHPADRRSTAAQIADLAEALDADLIVVGSRERSALAATLTGSTCQRLTHLTGRPILIVGARHVPVLSRRAETESVLAAVQTAAVAPNEAAVGVL